MESPRSPEPLSETPCNYLWDHWQWWRERERQREKDKVIEREKKIKLIDTAIICEQTQVHTCKAHCCNSAVFKADGFAQILWHCLYCFCCLLLKEPTDHHCSQLTRSSWDKKSSKNVSGIKNEQKNTEKRPISCSLCISHSKKEQNNKWLNCRVVALQKVYIYIYFYFIFTKVLLFFSYWIFTLYSEI